MKNSPKHTEEVGKLIISIFFYHLLIGDWRTFLETIGGEVERFHVHSQQNANRRATAILPEEFGCGMKAKITGTYSWAEQIVSM